MIETASLTISQAVLSVACPKCGAGQQEKCVSRTGRQTYDAHSARFAMAKRAGVFGEPAVSSVFDLGMIAHQPSRDALRRAAAGAPAGPVWITEGGERIAAIVPVEWAERHPDDPDRPAEQE